MCAKSHQLLIEYEGRSSVTGIYKVISFEPEQLLLLLEEDNLSICGSNLHVEKMDIEKGELTFTGKIDSVSYKKKRSKAAKEIVGRLFK